MDISLIVSLVLLGVVSLIVLISVLFGLKRGLKKSIMSFCWQLGIFILLLIFTGIITRALLNINISFLNIEIDGTKINYLSEIGALLLGEITVENATVATELLVSLPLMIINVIVFTLLFYLLRLITWPIYAIVCRFVFKKDRKAKKAWKKAGKPTKPVINGEVMPQKPKMRRGLGALVGVASGLLICFVTLMPIMGVNGYIQKLQNIKISSELATVITQNDQSSDPALLSAKTKLVAEDDRVSLITLFIEEDALKYLNLYEDCFVGKAFNIVGLNKLGSLTFNSLTKASVGGEKISLNSEIDNIIDLYNKAEILLVDYDLINATEDTFKNYSQNDWNTIISTSRSILNKAFESKIVSVILNNYFGDIVKITADEVLNEKIENDIDNLILKEISYTAIDYFIELGENHETSKFIYKEMDKLLEIAQKLNNYNLLNPLINNNYSKVLPSSVQNTYILENDLIKDFDIFVNYMNSLETSVYKKGEYLNTLAEDVGASISNISILSELLPRIEETALRNYYKQLFGEDRYNAVFTQAYLNASATFNINSSVTRFKEMNTVLFTNILKIVLNAGYNYDEINTLVTTIQNGGEDAMENIVSCVNTNTYLKNLLKEVGGLVDTITTSQAFVPEVKNSIINELFNNLNNTIKTSYNYDKLEEGDVNKKLCDAILNIVNNAGAKISGGNCAELMGTITDSFVKAFDAIQTLSKVTEIENAEDINIKDIADVLQDLTNDENGDALISNEDIANILDGALDSIAKDESIENSILNDKIETEDGEKTVSEIIVDNIKNNNVDWSQEGEIVEDIAQKAIELTNNAENIDTETIANEIENLLDSLITTDEQTGNKVSSSNIITPELVEYFKDYLNLNFKNQN